MKKQIILISVGAAVVLVLATLSSVIGSTVSHSQNEKTGSVSPLFSIRTARSVGGGTEKIQSSYLGKGSIPDIFPERSSLRSLIERSLILINAHPKTLDYLLEKITKSPQIMSILQQNHLTIVEVERYMYQLRDNPDMVLKEMQDIELTAPIIDFPEQPLGLNTSSALGCFITILVLLPIAITLGLLIATLLIVTCFNIGGCFETILSQILSSLIQELKQPDGSRYL